MPIFNNINGVYRKVSKPYCNVNGVQHQVKKAFCKVNGVWREAYTGAVEWTYTVKADTGGLFASGNDDRHSCIAGYSTNYSGTCIVTYYFSTAFLLRAGQTFSIRMFNQTNDGCHYYIKINETQVFKSGLAGRNSRRKEVYTAPNDIIISFIEVSIFCDGYECWNKGNIDVTVNADIGSFLLNNSGTSDK